MSKTIIISLLSLISLLVLLAACGPTELEQVGNDISGQAHKGALPGGSSECTETDNKDDPYTRGIVTYKNVEFRDFCDTENSLIEYYCQGNRMKDKTYSCTCLDGACQQSGPSCGDNSCDLGEDCNSCPVDCGQCPTTPSCGDNSCDPREDCNSCAVDCGVCPPSTGEIKVMNNVFGQTIKYIGFTEGARYNLQLIEESGANTYRYYLRPDRIFTRGDPFPEGYPTRDYIKNELLADWPSNRIRLESELKMSLVDEGFTKDWWGQGATIKRQIDDLLVVGITPTITVRPRESGTTPSWMPHPPLTEAEKDQVWYHAFAVFYYLNVLNDYGINIVHLDNEPSKKYKTTADYVDQVLPIMYDAVKTANDLVGLKTVANAAVDVTDTEGWRYLEAAVNTHGFIDNTDYHNWIGYNHDKRAADDAFVKGKQKPLFQSEAGTYEDVKGKRYSVFDPAKEELLPLKIAQSIFELSQLQKENPSKKMSGYQLFNFWAPWGDFSQGLVINGRITPAYQALRLETKCTAGAKSSYEISTNDPVLVTKDSNGIYVNSVNFGEAFTFTIDLSAILSPTTIGNVKVYEFSKANQDTSMPARTTELNGGKVSLTVPKYGAICAEII